jgi:hypothetical protein
VTTENRVIAVHLARGNSDEPLDVEAAQELVKAADVVRAFLDGTTVRLDWTVTIDGSPVPTPILPGGKMPTIAVAANVDDTTITFTVGPKDDHGNDTADLLTVTSDQADSTLGTLVVADDTHGAVFTLAQPQVEGSFNVTVADPSAPTVEDLVFAVTIGAGKTSALSGSATVA